MKNKKITENNDATIPLPSSTDDSNSGFETVCENENIVVVIDAAAPPVIEKKKRGRKKKLINPENAMSEIVTATDNPNSETNNAHANSGETNVVVVVHKKRGRKPRGGKIIQENLVHNNNVPELPNIILHLKCVLSDLKSSSSNISDVIDVGGNNQHENEIMCYNDQNVCGSEVCNYNDSTDSADSPIRPVSISNEEDNNSRNSKNIQNTQYNPSTFSNFTSSENCETNESLKLNSHAQLFSDWREKHQHHDDESENTSMKDILKKISQLKLSYNKSDIFQAIGSHRSACFWCTCDFDTPAIYIPKSIIKDSCNVYGCFCHPECAVAFLMDENIDTSTKFERYHLLNSMYGPIYNYDKSIKPAPNPYYLLNKFYGNLSIVEYRKLFKNEQLIYVVNKPLTHILPELYEDNNDFLVGNKIIQNNNIRKNQLKKKSNKTNIINEVFGVK
jgi:hypothetical protein